MAVLGALVSIASKTARRVRAMRLSMHRQGVDECVV
jgi:hypothetical protein